jgi:hypothetical protein
MHNALKKMGIFVIAILAVFCFAKNSQAYSQPTWDNWINGSTPYLGSYFILSGSQITAMGTFSAITSLTFTFSNSSGVTQFTTAQIQAVGFDGLQKCYQDSPTTSIPPGVSDVTFTFTCTGANSVNMAGGNIYIFPFAGNPSPSNDRAVLNTEAFFAYPILASGYIYQPTGTTTPVFKFAINTGYTPTSASVNFQAPSYYDGMITTDFQNWTVCANVPNQNGDITVTYGTSSPIGNLDSLAGNLGLTTIPIKNGDCFIINKTASTTPGSYQAQATVWDSNNVSIASSTILNFTITGGNSTSYPNQQPALIPIAGCSATNFKISFFTGYEIDFGNGLCNVARFLFVPSQNVINQFTGTAGFLPTTPPFSYLYSLSSQIGTASGTSASMTPLSIKVGATTSPFHIQADMFSGATIDKYTDSSVRTALRNLMKWSLYLAFMAMVILEVRHLFRPNKPTV